MHSSSSSSSTTTTTTITTTTTKKNPKTTPHACNLFCRLNMPAIEVARLLDCMSSDWREQAKLTKTIRLLPKGISDGVPKWGKGIAKENFQQINTYIGYGGGKPTYLEKTLSTPPSRSGYVKQFLQKAIGAEVNTPAPPSPATQQPVRVKVAKTAKPKAAGEEGKTPPTPKRPRESRGHKLVGASGASSNACNAQPASCKQASPELLVN